MLEHIGDILGARFSAKMMSKIAQNRSNFLDGSLSLSQRRPRVLTVCQQRRWQVLEHCSNSRIRAGVGPKSVLTADLGGLTLDRGPWVHQAPASYRLDTACIQLGENLPRIRGKRPPWPISRNGITLRCLLRPQIASAHFRTRVPCSPFARCPGRN